MEINLITGATTYEAAINTIKKIDISNLEQQNLVVVPDSFSMQAEKLIFDVLKIKSTFNIEVVGISRLASKILRNNNIPFQRISALEEVFSIFKAVKENEEKFSYFHKCGVDFCVKILQIIKQFKACQVKPEQIKPVGDDLLDRKMNDLKLIYSSYENFLDEKFDLSKLLEFFIENAENDLNLSKINLFFINFDSFSVEINSFVCKLASFVNKTFIGMAKPISPANAFIYEDDIFKKTTKMAKDFGVSVQVENKPTALQAQKLKMVQNLFAFKVESGKDDFFVNVVAKNRTDEVEFVAKYVKNQVYSGKNFRNFAVAVSDESYYEIVNQIFSQYDICFYSDKAADLSQTILGRFLLKILEIAKMGFSKASLEYLVSCPLFVTENRSKILEEVFYFNIEDEKEFLKRYPEFEKIVEKIKILRKTTKISQFVLILNEILDKTDIEFSEILSKLDDDGKFKEKSENEQSFRLLQQVLEKLSLLGGEENIDIFDFDLLLKLALKSVKVETIPNYVDAVFVGDATKSYFEDIDTLFVLGATADNLPYNQADTGIIDDDDIKKLKANFLIEPEIKVLNRRSRLKLFEMLQHAERHLFICTPASLDGKQAQKAGFVGDLLTMFGNNILRTESLSDFEVGVLNKNESLEKLLFYLGTETNFLRSYTALKSQGKLSKRFVGELRDIRGELPKSNDFSNLNVTKNSKNYVSASELETYFACPFKRFLTYDLKLKQKENIEPNRKLFGIFQHALLKEFVEKFKDRLATLDENDIDKFLEKNLARLAENVYDKKVLERASFSSFLLNESKIILKNVIKEQKYSDFRPILLEEKIFESLFKDKNLVGYVDRIDVWQDYFRIIDYKTGKTDSIKKDLYYGKKLQLFLYANAIKNRLELDCAGVYYFNCQTKYSKTNESEKLFNGLTKRDNDIVLATDTRLQDENFKSDFVGMLRKKSVKDGEFEFKNGNVVLKFDRLFEYAQNVSSQAADEISAGYSAAKPAKSECENCPYLSICRHIEGDGYRVLVSLKKKDEENDN